MGSALRGRWPLHGQSHRFLVASLRSSPSQPPPPSPPFVLSEGIGLYIRPLKVGCITRYRSRRTRHRRSRTPQPGLPRNPPHPSFRRRPESRKHFQQAPSRDSNRLRTPHKPDAALNSDPQPTPPYPFLTLYPQPPASQTAATAPPSPTAPASHAQYPLPPPTPPASAQPPPASFGS